VLIYVCEFINLMFACYCLWECRFG